MRTDRKISPKKILGAGILAFSVKLGKRIPLKVTHTTTERCNFRCKYCYNKTYVKKPEMNTEQVKSCMKEFQEMGTKIWKFGGGEPLIREDIDELILWGKKLGFILNMDTNGSFVHKKLDILKNLDLIQLSFDGPEEYQDRTRQNGCFKNVERSIADLKSINLTPLLNCVITKENTQHIGYVCNYAKKNKCFLNLQPVVPMNKEAAKLMSKELIDKKVFEKILKVKKTNHYIANSDSNLKRGIEYFSGKIKRFQKKCLAGVVYCTISPGGNVGRCHHDLTKDSPNGLEMGFKKAFYSLRFDKCDCLFNAYYDLSRLYGLNPGYIYRAIKNLSSNRWIHY